MIGAFSESGSSVALFPWRVGVKHALGFLLSMMALMALLLVFLRGYFSFQSTPDDSWLQLKFDYYHQHLVEHYQILGSWQGLMNSPQSVARISQQVNQDLTEVKQRFVGHGLSLQAYIASRVFDLPSHRIDDVLPGLTFSQHDQGGQRSQHHPYNYGDIHLLSEEGVLLIGHSLPPASALARAIVVDGKTVGWLSRPSLVPYLQKGSLRGDSSLWSLVWQQIARHGSIWLSLVGAVFFCFLLIWGWWCLWPLWVARSQIRRLVISNDTTTTTTTTTTTIRKTVPALSFFRWPISVTDFGRWLKNLDRIQVRLLRQLQAKQQWQQQIQEKYRVFCDTLSMSLKDVENEIPQISNSLSSISESVNKSAPKTIKPCDHALAQDFSSLLDYHHRTALLNRKVCSLSQLLSAACLRHESVFMVKNLRIQYRAPWWHRCEAMIDETVMTKVMDVLLDNCARYTEPEGKVMISLRKKYEGYSIKIQDSQPSMSLSSLWDLLDDTARVIALHNPLSKNPYEELQFQSSYGVGLALASAMVTAHGGHLSIAPSVHGGLCVEIELPSMLSSSLI